MKIAIIDANGVAYDGYTLLHRGLGGSESAIILISRELVNVGFHVTVFNNCIDSEAMPGTYDGVKYVDHSQVTDYDNEIFDVVISSRSVYPFFGNSIHKFATKAKKKILWMHDTFCRGDEHIEPMLECGAIDEIFTLSDFHTSYVTTCAHGNKRMFEVLKKKVFMTRNGAVKWISEIDLSKKDKNLFVYNSSVTKGLIPLIEDVWPEVKKYIPEAKLIVIGGYYRFREGAEPDEQEKTLRKLASDTSFAELDITFTGVIKQIEIAEILSKANFMIYPTAFPETFGISVLEALLYKTPVITNRFGALEETAIDMACYKVNYPTVPNGLFPNINKNDQVNKFVTEVLRAYDDHYLHSQKREYCSVVDDIYGWDTIALQWKQHLYRIFGKYLSVAEHRKVSRINEKVSRIHGRRFHNYEDTETYRSYGRQKRIVIISPFYNAENYITRCIESVACQEYDNYLHILIDDCSTDYGYDRAEEYINSLDKNLQKKFMLIKNDINVGAVANQVRYIKKQEKNDIIMLLDGDDCLVNNNTIFHLYNDLYETAEFTYGSCWSMADNIPLVAQDYPGSVKTNKTYRKHKFAWNMPYTHLRTFKCLLFDYIDKSSLRDENGEYMRAGGDGSLFYALLEEAEPSKVIAVKEIVCVYNDVNPLNDYKVNKEEQQKNAKRILDYEKNFDSSTNQ
jgi:glycosyltransferase involved in cell wall biosynthesis